MSGFAWGLHGDNIKDFKAGRGYMEGLPPGRDVYRGAVQDAVGGLV